MRRPHLLVAWAAAAVAAACGGGAGEPPPAGAADPGSAGREAALPITVAVTVAPLAWLSDEVGGERVETTVVIPPGQEPHTYEPSPRDVAALSRARVFVAVGHRTLTFEQRFIEPLLAARPEIEVVRLVDWDQFVGSGNPHVWLSPDRMRSAARELAGALSQVDPAGAAGYRERLAAVEQRIEEVDAEVAAQLSDLPRSRFLVYHPAWEVFAYHYGLSEVSIEEHAKEPGPRELAAKIDAARADGFATVFVQQGFADRPARVIASEIGARVVVLDPLARDWDVNLLAAAAALREELDRPLSADPETAP